MKALSAREYQILHFLLERRDFVPVKEMASQMNWSEKTIYRELNALEHSLNRRGIHLRKPQSTSCLSNLLWNTLFP
ncbi:MULTISPECIES: HTH domain-containing protein [Paenibacillus]|uniref:HTH domain-containing protein n=1 Tax=Paenibacillus pabuli TaxID=1472 RepID=A0A855Y6C9_9BACL|nr:MULTISPECIES: HTH domain-containing protein [Paenibacillus]PWW38171.1 HTH domain-containing protein [Paenibacillus pabuli]PXW08398.1 HTH domain-containing protein [Paenibacillus taichungensis]RAI99212.1 HTH domain-containing protein [Paenibacillus pabuli]